MTRPFDCHKVAQHTSIITPKGHTNCPQIVMRASRRHRNASIAVLIVLVLELISTDAFSTISNSRVPAPALLNGQRSSSARSSGGGSYASLAGVENGHTNNYVTAIEDCVSFENGERGLFVATTDHNYAIQSPSLRHEQGWQSVTVNGDKVFVLTIWNRTFSTSLSSLNEQQRDFIAEARANFTQNLAGLRLAHYTSGTSTSLPSGSTLGSSGSGYNSATRPSVAELVIAQMVGPSGQQWSPFVSSAAGTTSRPQEYQHTQGSGAASAPASAAPPNFQASQAQTFLEANSLPPSAASFFSSKRRNLGTNETLKADSSVSKKPEVVGSSKLASKKPETIASSKKAQRTLARYAQAPPPQQFIYTPNYNGQTGDPLTSKSLCSPARWLDSFNYYNLNAGSPLNKSLAGDVYFFDFHCNTLDVYSSSVSMRHSLGMSAIYRDANFFSFSRSNLPSAINRIFLVDKHAFLIYNDGSLLVKANWMLESYELDLIVQARTKLKLIGAWQSRAANLMAS